MPNLGLEKEQASAIATFLLTQHEGSPPADASSSLALNQTRITKGKRLFDNLGCFGCHTVLGEGRSVGPELTNIRSKVSPQWLYGWIQNPKNYFPNSRMPVLNLTTEQSEEIGDYLLSVGTGKPGPNDFAPSLTDERAKELGAKLVAERGCAGCHDIKGFDRISAPELTHVGDKSADVLEFGNVKGVSRNLYSYVLQKITDPRSFDTDKFKGKMPKFGLAKEDAKTIDIYLMSLSGQELPPEYTKDLQEQSSSLVAGRKIFEDHDCNACHRLSGEGGKVGPDLTREGEMVRPGWMFEFLKNPTRIRWWQDSRMPNYHLTDNEATTLTEYFMALANQPAPYEYTPVADKLFPLARIGAKYFEELKCQSCHPLAGKQGVAGGDTKKLGPDLGMAPTRLKKDWMFRFLKDPQGFSPGTQMPTFSKPDEQYQAIVDFLMKQKSP
jgi:cytochrome c2